MIRMSTQKIETISIILRELYEAIENNMVLDKNIALVRGVSPIARFENTRQRALRDLNLVTNRVEELIGAPLQTIRRDNEKYTNMLVTSAMRSFNRDNARIIRSTKSQELKEKIIQHGIDNGLRINYGKGRTMGYKEYMEMNVRTTLQREVGTMQLVSGKEAGVVFYICNHFADCADDHKDYQGKIYYDERWAEYGYDDETTAKIKSRIKDMKSVQEVRGNKPYLTTRPNCRHTFTPISLEQALNVSARDLVKDLKLSSGSYRDKNYELTQEQRYNERNIRKYKNRLEQNIELSKTDPTYAKYIERDKRLVRQWQKRNNELVKNNHDILSRDYRRETQKVLIQDLGAKFDL